MGERERARTEIQVGAWVAATTYQWLVEHLGGGTGRCPWVFDLQRLESLQEASAWRASHRLPLILELGLCTAGVTPLQLELLSAPTQRPIVLIGRVNEVDMRALGTFASIPGTHLFIERIDPAEFIAEILVSEFLLEVVERRATARLSSHVRAIVLEAIQSPADWTVKRMAAEAGISRRGLERQLQRVGLPTPGRILLRHKNR